MDTSLDSPNDIADSGLEVSVTGESYRVEARSIIMLRYKDTVTGIPASVSRFPNVGEPNLMCHRYKCRSPTLFTWVCHAIWNRRNVGTLIRSNKKAKTTADSSTPPTTVSGSGMHNNPFYGQKGDDQNIGYGGHDYPFAGTGTPHAVTLAQAVQRRLASKHKSNERKRLKRTKIEAQFVFAKEQRARAKGEKTSCNDGAAQR